MRHWVVPFLVGLGLAILLLAAAWFSTAFLPDSIPASIMKADLRADPAFFAARYLPEAKEAVQRTFLLATSSVAIGYIIVSVFHLVRPIGPGGAASGWRHLVWFLTLILIVVSTAGSTYASLSIWLLDADDSVATQWSLYVALVAVLLFWIITIVGSERMMRPAIPLASRAPV